MIIKKSKPKIIEISTQQMGDNRNNNKYQD